MTSEGVTKYENRHSPAALDAASIAALRELVGWRNVLRRAGLLGQDPARYDGAGYGNVSARRSSGGFVISGTQTSGLTVAQADHFVCVHNWVIAENMVESTGPVAPSSEAMTHAVIYDARPDCGCVLHVHCPEIWSRAADLGLATTPARVAYGTVDMARCVAELVRSPEQRARANIFAMLGHEDGVVAFGEHPRAAANLLFETFARALGPRSEMQLE